MPAENLTEPEAALLIAGTAELALLMAGIGFAGDFVIRRRKLVWPSAGRPEGVVPWRLSWLDFGIFVWLVFTVQLVVGHVVASWVGPAGAAGGAGDRAGGPAIAVGALAMQLGLLLTFVGFRRWGPRPVGDSLARPDPGGDALSSRPLGLGAAFGRAGYALLAAVPLLLVVSLLIKLLLRLWEVEMEPQPLVSAFGEQESVLGLAALIVLAVAVAPVVEELVFRGGIYRFLKGRMGAWAAMSASGLIFALVHAHLEAFLLLFALGYLLAYAYEATGNILVPMLMHALFNAHTVGLVLLLGEAIEQL